MIIHASLFILFDGCKQWAKERQKIDQSTLLGKHNDEVRFDPTSQLHL